MYSYKNNIVCVINCISETIISNRIDIERLIEKYKNLNPFKKYVISFLKIIHWYLIMIGNNMIIQNWSDKLSWVNIFLIN